jgi:hypothetical protein
MTYRVPVVESVLRALPQTVSEINLELLILNEEIFYNLKILQIGNLQFAVYLYN